MGIAEAATSHHDCTAAAARIGAIAVWVARSGHSLLSHCQAWVCQASPVRMRMSRATMAVLVRVQAAPAAKTPKSWVRVPVHIWPPVMTVQVSQAAVRARAVWAML